MEAKYLWVLLVLVPLEMEQIQGNPKENNSLVV
jgi:hypothetical protein